MVKRRYVPERGDIVWLNFGPVRGHEQGGKRPALIISRSIYNERTDLAIICPITSRAKGYEFEVALPEDSPVHGVVLSDHARSLDWRARRAKFSTRVPHALVSRVADLISILVEGM